MKNYYDILGIEPHSSQSAIKKAFRKKAKEIHPDVTNHHKKRAEEEMRLLISAYRVLKDPHKRMSYDRILRNRPKKYEFNYRKYLKSRKHNLYSQAKLILYDLLNGYSKEAIGIYEKLQANTTFILENYLSYEDYMDCAFLLAEEYERLKEYSIALKILVTIFKKEKQRAYFRHFIEEIVERIHNIACNKIIKKKNMQVCIDYLNMLIDLRISDKYNALFYRKLSEIYLRIGKKDYAIECLKKGFKIYNKLKITKRLKQMIGLQEISV